MEKLLKNWKRTVNANSINKGDYISVLILLAFTFVYALTKLL